MAEQQADRALRAAEGRFMPAVTCDSHVGPPRLLTVCGDGNVWVVGGM